MAWNNHFNFFWPLKLFSSHVKNNFRFSLGKFRAKHSNPQTITVKFWLNWIEYNKALHRTLILKVLKSERNVQTLSDNEGKVHIFWEGHKILQNLHLTFDCVYCTRSTLILFYKQRFISNDFLTSLVF